ncbi:MAG: hypothetical protein JST81_03755 [Bacteroidetes bacterium]|jgi:hypothetical protein|nr:hypothetical protein [Bacteroidota bacterium]
MKFLLIILLIRLLALAADSHGQSSGRGNKSLVKRKKIKMFRSIFNRRKYAT